VASFSLIVLYILCGAAISRSTSSAFDRLKVTSQVTLPSSSISFDQKNWTFIQCQRSFPRLYDEIVRAEKAHLALGGMNGTVAQEAWEKAGHGWLKIVGGRMYVAKFRDGWSRFSCLALAHPFLTRCHRL
jgi:hypothetical protein